MKTGLHIQNSPEWLQSLMVRCCKCQLVSTIEDELRLKKKKSFPELMPILKMLLKGSPNTVLGKWTDAYQRHFPVLMNAC